MKPTAHHLENSNKLASDEPVITDDMGLDDALHVW
jgi:hypothetical protein